MSKLGSKSSMSPMKTCSTASSAPSVTVRLPVNLVAEVGCKMTSPSTAFGPDTVSRASVDAPGGRSGRWARRS